MERLLQETKTIAHRVLLDMLRSRRSLIFWVGFPALMLLLFGLIYAGRGELGASFDRTAPGILIGAALFFSCLGGPVAVIVGERERATLRRLLISPLRPGAYFSGIVAAHVAIALGQAVIVYAIAALFGGRYRGSVALGGLILLLSVCSYVGMGFYFGARFSKRTEDVNGPVAAFGVPLLVLGGTFFPAELLPPFLLRVAYFDPIYHMNAALRPVWARGAGWSEVGLHVLCLLLFAALSLALGTRAYGSMLQRERTS